MTDKALPTLTPWRGQFWHSPARSSWWIVGFLFAILFCSRWLGIRMLGDGRSLNNDELEMLRSCMDRFLGIPSTSLAWPGTIIQLLGLPVIIVDFLFHAKGHPSPAGFLDYMAAFERNPWHLLRVFQIGVALVTCASIAVLYRTLLRLSGSVVGSVLLVLLLGTAPVLWNRSQMVMGDALAIAFACLAAWVVIRQQPSLGQVAAAGVFIGLMLAARVTALFVLPLFAGLVLWLSPKRFRAAILFCCCIAAGFIFACPAVWNDPLRLAKSILGNATRPGVRAGIVMAMKTSLPASSLLLMLAFPFALLVAIVKRQTWWALGLAASFFGLLVVAMRATMLSPHYMLALVVITTLALASALPGIVGAFPARIRKVVTILLACLCLAQIAFNGSIHRRDLSQIRETLDPNQSTRVMELITADLQPLHLKKPVLLPDDYGDYIVCYGTSESLRTAADRVERRDAGGQSVMEFLSVRLPPDQAVVLAKNFDEDEQARIARYRLAARIEPPDALNFVLWADSITGRRFGMPNFEQSAAMLDGRLAAAMLSDHPLAGRTPFKTYDEGRLFLYVAPPDGKP